VSGEILLIPIFVPIAFALFVSLFEKRAWALALTASLASLLASLGVFLSGGLEFTAGLGEWGVNFNLMSDDLSSMILLGITFFAFIIIVYSARFVDRMKGVASYYSNVLFTLGIACGAALANDLIMLLVFWGASGLTLYNLIGLGGPRAADAAKKTFIILGGTDALMILGAAIIWMLSGTFEMSLVSLPLNETLPAIAFVSLLIGAMAKAGAIPFHTWIPDSSDVAPLPVMAYLPAALDKLLGIYLLARISLNMFLVVPGSPVSTALMTLGSVTIVTAVMAALVQHNMKKLLSFHAVSQVGYMILGIGTGIPVAIAGGLFHMLNNAIYKCCLFLGGGAVEKKVGTAELDKLGGLAGLMPVTFFSMFVAALSISGIPPFNGFVSKWMIYQGVISLSDGGGWLWMLFLASAMFGSALTLASFMKLLHATFLGKASRPVSGAGEAPRSMLYPMVALAALCLVFGVFAFQIPLRYLIFPIVPFTFFEGFWSPVAASLLLIIGLAAGALIYLAGRAMAKVRTAPAFIGGESIPDDRLKVSGVRFYDTIRDISIIGDFYEESERRVYDIYEQLKKVTFWLSDFFKWMHSGLLHTYLAWCLLGLVILLFVFFWGI